ncbi:MAG: alpha/beta-hydrolase family protein [Candidatus Microbacterium colombiense]|nr:MAG: alpha/beta-hydrolase family protein [Microbacterium sp.]
MNIESSAAVDPPTENVRPSRRWWHLDPGGALAGLLLAALSVTPSLLPRPALFQGAVTAVAFAVGYVLGVVAWRLLRGLIRVRPGRAAIRLLWGGYGVVWLGALAGLSVLSLTWQNEVRALVEMRPLDGGDLAAFLTGFIPLTIVLLAIGKGTRRLFHALRRLVGIAVATLGTATVVAAGAAGLLLATMISVDTIYAGVNAAPEAGVVEPASTDRSAGPESAIEWDDLGRHGAAFVGGGPRADDIEALTGAPAVEPIRVYAGLASADTMQERAELVVEELERTGAFDREVLVVATTTGSGWLESQTVDAIEYLHAGDTAIAALQYAYTPSWVSFVFDPDAPVEAARVLFDAVEERWLRIPEGERPQLISYGLSLGAHGSQAVFDDLADLRARTDGSMFVGSPAGSRLWGALQHARDPGSPVWRPVLDGGREVRWISRDGDQDLLDGPWSSPRVLYLQHATDPVTWLTPELLWRAPEWLEPDQRGADVSPSMRWIPVVTAVQVGIDMLGGEAVPARHGHNFGDVVTTGWLEVTGSPLDEAAIAAIQAEIESYAPLPPFQE